MLSVSVTDGFTVSLLYLLETDGRTDRRQSGSFRPDSLPNILFFHNQKKAGYALSSDLLSIYSIEPTETLLANLTRISEPGFVVILCGHRGPGTKKHMGANAYTKKSCYATGGCLWLGHARS